MTQSTQMTITEAPRSWRIQVPGGSFTFTRLLPESRLALESAPDVQGYRWHNNRVEVCSVVEAHLVRVQMQTEPGQAPDFDRLGREAAAGLLRPPSWQAYLL